MIYDSLNYALFHFFFLFMGTVNRCENSFELSLKRNNLFLCFKNAPLRLLLVLQRGFSVWLTLIEWVKDVSFYYISNYTPLFIKNKNLFLT